MKNKVKQEIIAVMASIGLTARYEGRSGKGHSIFTVRDVNGKGMRIFPPATPATHKRGMLNLKTEVRKRAIERKLKVN